MLLSDDHLSIGWKLHIWDKMMVVLRTASIEHATLTIFPIPDANKYIIVFVLFTEVALPTVIEGKRTSKIALEMCFWSFPVSMLCGKDLTCLPVELYLTQRKVSINLLGLPSKGFYGIIWEFPQMLISILLHRVRLCSVLWLTSWSIDQSRRLQHLLLVLISTLL